MTRIPKWTDALEAFMRKPLVFEWGVSDCCLVSADAVNTITNVDIASEFRNQYTTQLGAFKTIATVTGGKTVEDAVCYCAAKHGLVEWTHPLCAQRGDLVLVKNADDLIAGFVAMDGKNILSVGEGGLVRLPLTAIHRAWKV